MAVKTYISLLEILRSVSNQIVKDTTHHFYIEYPSNYPRRPEIGVKPFLILTSEDSKSAVIHVVCPSSIDYGYGTGTTRSYATMNVNTYLREDAEYFIPNILELEFLKQSDVELTDDEWELVEQLMILQLIQCNAYLRSIAEEPVRNELNVSTTFLMEKSWWHLYELDLEKEPEQLEKMVMEKYKLFKPLETYPTAVHKSLIYSWMTAPISTSDVFSAMDTWLECHKLSSLRLTHSAFSKFVNYIPMLLTFAVLERKAGIYNHYTYDDFAAYMNMLPDTIEKQLENNEQLPLTEQLPFSYGYQNGQLFVESNSDSYILIKVLSMIANWMKEVCSKNISTISVNYLSSYKNKALKSMIVLLNKYELSWEKEDDEEHDDETTTIL